MRMRVECGRAGRRAYVLNGATASILRSANPTSVETMGDETSELTLTKVLGHGVYGTVYAGRVGRAGEPAEPAEPGEPGEPAADELAVKCVPLLDECVWRELLDHADPSASPEHLARHFQHWQRTMALDAADPVNNAALCEVALYRMASELGQTTGAPWFLALRGAFRVGTLDTKGPPHTPPQTRRPGPRRAWVDARRADHRAIVRAFHVRVPSILICTERCRESVGDRVFAAEPFDYDLMSALLAQAACAALFLRSIGLSHNDFHTDNLMLIETARTHIDVSGDHNSRWRVPTHGCLLKVVDFGLSTASAGAMSAAPPASQGDARSRKRQRDGGGPLLNEASLSGIRYRHDDPDADLRTLLLDVATRTDSVFPPAASDPTEGAAHVARSAVDRHYRGVAHSIESFARAVDDRPGDRPWLLKLLEDREALDRQIAAIDSADDEDPELDEDLFGPLGGCILAIRRVANSPHTTGRLVTVPPAVTADLFLGAFSVEPGDAQNAEPTIHLPAQPAVVAARAPPRR